MPLLAGSLTAFLSVPVHLEGDVRLSCFVAIICVGGGDAETNGSQEYIFKFEERQDAAARVGHKDSQLHLHHKAPGPSYLAMAISVLISLPLAGQHPN